ncbi:hypothetical protein NEOLEDRAFT_860415 [Neolentinus lepideus HHB14362 ss-1]|uniref:Uncharacterized protein n=1 Tax=Neolentinus lepideus HHB14362 ss-1 TaxID=1314782 RepID=A0A165URS5_9AGAM|nr:hypothetical protein NEOLEDRAFT_860415 [Neolentinus lepideus HHB14362 ss-1]
MALVLPPNPDIAARPPPWSAVDAPAVLQVPNVFVIPPEEEQADSPPYCCFDAAAPLEDELVDMESLDAALNLVHYSSNSPPMFHRPYENDGVNHLTMPRRADIPGAQSQLAQEWENAVREARRHRDTGEDSEIIEVIKVRRNEGMDDIFDGGLEDEILKKKDKTLRSRASQAFRSIKNIGKGNRKGNSKNVLAQRQEGRESFESTSTTILSENLPGQVNPPRAESPEECHRKLSRRKSRPLSSIFTLSQGNRSSSNIKANSTVAEAGPSLAGHEPQATITTSSSMGSSITTDSWSSISAEDPDIFINLVLPDDLPSRSVSPSLSVKRSFRKRLSILSLNRIFTSSTEFSEEPLTARPAPAPYPIPMPISPDSRSVQFSPCPTASSSEALDTPTDDVYRSPTLPSLPRSSMQIITQDESEGGKSPSDSRGSMSPSESRGSMPSSGSTTTQSSKPPSSTENGEEVEMRLDSLHFDSLHFDAEEFNISLS